METSVEQHTVGEAHGRDIVLDLLMTLINGIFMWIHMRFKWMT